VSAANLSSGERLSMPFILDEARYPPSLDPRDDGSFKSVFFIFILIRLQKKNFYTRGPRIMFHHVLVLIRR